MRTTLTLEPDVARLIGEEVHRQRKSLKDVVNDALRRGLSPGTPRVRAPRFRIVPHRTKLQPGIDRAAFNRLADELDDEASLGKHRRRG